MTVLLGSSLSPPWWEYIFLTWLGQPLYSVLIMNHTTLSSTTKIDFIFVPQIREWWSPLWIAESAHFQCSYGPQDTHAHHNERGEATFTFLQWDTQMYNYESKRMSLIVREEPQPKYENPHTIIKGVSAQLKVKSWQAQYFQSLQVSCKNLPKWL